MYSKLLSKLKVSNLKNEGNSLSVVFSITFIDYVSQINIILYTS